MNQLNLFEEPNLHLAQHYSNPKLKKLISGLETKYKVIDESDFFKSLVNFSTSKDTPYSRWVRYREGYSTRLVEELIKRSNIKPENHFIADPMVGSGSSMIAGMELGFDTIGLDVNPYSIFLTNSKLTRPDSKVLTDLNIVINQLYDAVLPDDFTFSEYRYHEYFSSENLIWSEYLREFINELHCPDVKQICRVAWYMILEDISNRKKDGNGLVTRPSKVKDVKSYYIQKLKDIAFDYSYASLPEDPQYRTYVSSAFNLSKYSKSFSEDIDKSLGAVIFSPPYANSFNYFESYKLELLYGGFYTSLEFEEAKKDMIRNYRKGYGKEITSNEEIVELICEEVWASIPIKEKRTGKRDSRTRLVPNMLRGYFEDMQKVLSEIYKSMTSKGHCYIVVDQSAYVGKVIPTDIILAKLAEDLGFKVDYISKCRKANTSGQQIRDFPYLNQVLRESIVAISKP